MVEVMAELIGLASSVLSIAALGATVVTTLRSFARSYSGAEQKISDLAADVALTASILIDLGKTIEECEEEFHLNPGNFSRAKAACHRNFEMLETALQQAKRQPKSPRESKSAKKFQEQGQVVSAWDRLRFALGGEEGLMELVTSIETSKSNLQLLLDSVNLLILKKLNKKHLLNEDQAQDLRVLILHVPMLLKSLQDAQLLKLVPRSVEAKPPKMVPESERGPVRKGAEVVTDTKAHGYTSKQECTIQAENEVLEADKEAFQSYQNPEEELYTTHGTPSGDKIPEKALNLQFDKGLPSDTNKTKPQVQFESARTAEDDPITILHQPADPSSQPNESSPQHPILSSSRETDNTRTLYEGWLLHSEKSMGPSPTVVTFCGLKLRIYNPPPLQVPVLYTLSPFSIDQEDLQKHVKEFNKRNKQLTTSLDSLLGGFDGAARNEILQLLNERNRWAPEPHGWKIIAILTMDDPKETRTVFGMRKPSKKSASKWLVVLKGGVIDAVETLVVNLPDRFSNPWQSLVPPLSHAELPDKAAHRMRLEEDLRKSGGNWWQRAEVLKKESALGAGQPTFTRMARRHLSLETLNHFMIDYMIDQDPEFVVIKRWVPEYEQDFLWDHTRRIREQRHGVVLSIEEKKKGHSEPEFEFVRKSKRTGKSDLLSFLAGGPSGAAGYGGSQERERRRPERFERVVIEENRERRRERGRRDSDEVVVIEEHSPPRRSRRVSDTSNAGSTASESTTLSVPVVEVEGSMEDDMDHATGQLPQEQAEILMDKFLETFLAGSISSSSSSRRSLVED